MAGVRGCVVVTGTDTGVGKTVVTAAIAAAARASGLSVAVIKPAQTGISADEESDVDTVVRLASPDYAATVAAYPNPLAPATAARVSGLAPVTLRAVVEAVRDQRRRDLILIEGAGGLLVRIGADWTMADLCLALESPAVVVARAGLGTLNHTTLTLEALARRRIEPLVVIGAWPAEPELVHQTNLEDLGAIEGVIPDGVGTLAPEEFRAAAAGWLSPRLHGNRPQ